MKIKKKIILRKNVGGEILMRECICNKKVARYGIGFCGLVIIVIIIPLIIFHLKVVSQMLFLDPWNCDSFCFPGFF